MASSGRRREPIHGINITPLVDILLVLLILVLVTGTLAAPRSLDVELPRSTSAASDPSRPSEIAVSGDGSLRIDGAPATFAQVRVRLQDRTRVDSLHKVLVAAPRSIPYEKVVEVLDLVREAGARRYALRVEEGK